MRYRVAKKDGKTIIYREDKKAIIFCNKLANYLGCIDGCRIYDNLIKKRFDATCVNPSTYNFNRKNLDRLFKRVFEGYDEEFEEELF
jgi:hypothetical protein